MVDRIKCASCGAEGMADGKLHCDACYTELLRRKREGQDQAAQRIAELRVQRDELLAACENALDMLEMMVSEGTLEYVNVNGLKEAIAKARGEE